MKVRVHYKNSVSSKYIAIDMPVIPKVDDFINVVCYGTRSAYKVTDVRYTIVKVDEYIDYDMYNYEGIDITIDV